ncbi:TetR/AcrR family transcriptional regulator [Acidocella sp.]|uniref:TetR/AcrR family transcriptional regulator n=1 Tax=Acidocella sp. TaxID=50710 RepID=UPI002F41D997
MATVEAAAHILEQGGFDHYSTNAIAERAGVSIGSLYQYFPNKDAITRALIARETRLLVEAVAAVPQAADWQDAMTNLIRAAVDHQLRRPRLARLIDIEESRLGGLASDFDTGAAPTELLRPAVARAPLGRDDHLEEIIGDILIITRALTDAAGERPDIDRENLERRIRRAIFGYVTFSPVMDA